MFDEDSFYTTDDEKLAKVWPAWKLAKWRSQGRGPAYHKYGKRILYSGRDLNAFLDAHRIEPAAA